MSKLEICCLRYGYNDELQGLGILAFEARHTKLWGYWRQQGDVDVAWDAYNRGRDHARKKIDTRR